jgi:hypothetical protein
MRGHGVQALMMGGQACVLFGAAEFSRDADFAVLADPENLGRLRAALEELRADVIAVPPFEIRHLERGHAVHFRCRHPDAAGLRVDVMARLRGVDPFPALWERRTTWDLGAAGGIDTLSLPDLVASKKTQRDKDWPMLRRLVEVSYDADYREPTPPRVEFWLRELRTPELLIECAARFPAAAAVHPRPAVLAIAHGPGAVEAALRVEENREREMDRAYWTPLKAELEAMRHGRGPTR